MNEVSALPNENTPVIPAVETVEEQARKCEVQYPVNGVDQILAGMVYVLAFLAVDTFNMFTNPQYYGVGVTFFTCCYGITILIYGKRSGKTIGKEGIFWFVIMGLSAASYLWVYHQSLMEFQALFLRLVIMYFTIAVFGVQIEGRTGSLFILDGLNMLILIPFANWKAHGKALQVNQRYVPWIRGAGKAILGLLVAAPLFVVVALLLCYADYRFAELLDSLSKRISSSVLSGIWNLILAIPVSAYLFGLVYGSAHQRKTNQINRDKVTHCAKVCKIIPRASIYAVLVAFCLLYGMFIGLQGSYYLDALAGVLPEGFTYSDYARQGFFELVTVSIINIGIILFTALFGKAQGEVDGKRRNGSFLKWCNALISVLTLFLIATAMTKMFLYIKVYGLTPLRVIPSLFMAFLAVLFLLIIVSQFKKVPVVRLGLYTFAMGYALLSVSNMDGWIARYNLERYVEGSLTDFPMEVLLEGELASVPEMYRVWSNTDREQLKLDLSDAALRIHWWSDELLDESGALKYKNVTKNQAIWQLREMTEWIPEEK